jgi:hypothetical protein
MITVLNVLGTDSNESRSTSPNTTLTATCDHSLRSHAQPEYTTFDSLPNAVPDVTTARTNEQQTVSKPEARRLADIFPPYLCSSIGKLGTTASITMAFPARLSVTNVDCLMSLSILPNKVQYLAMELFGVHVESDAGYRYLVLENGVRVLVGSEVVIQGGKDAGIEKLLGPEPSLAIRKSPLRKEEIKQGMVATNCVTLRMPGSCEYDSILNLCLGLDEAFRLKDALFK